MGLESKVDKLTGERRFVETALRAAKSSSNGELNLFAYRSYDFLLSFSEKARNDLDAKNLWDMLPDKIKCFYPTLNVYKSGN